MGSGIGEDGAPQNTLSTAHHHAVATGGSVRRMTPVECERLQGFPDGHTDVPFRGKDAQDGPRYKALGNSKAVPVIKWVGERIIKHLKGEI
jgi:DNA (cytosine-5)-methyltransferase 1